MASRIQQFNLLSDPLMLQQVSGSLLHVAAQVLAEDLSTPNHEERANLAHQIMSQPSMQAQMMMPWLLQNATIANGAGGPVQPASGTAFADSDIDFVVSSLYNTLAGV